MTDRYDAKTNLKQRTRLNRSRKQGVFFRSLAITIQS